MTDVIELLAAASPNVDDEPVPAVDDVWRKLDMATFPHERTLRRPRLRGFQRRHRLILGSTASALAATVAAIVLLSAGSTPSAAQAFPILAKPARDIRVGLRVLRHAHEFAEASGNGYVLETSNGDTLCVDSYPPPGLLPRSPSAHDTVCESTAHAEQHGILESVYWAALPGDYRFVALVPVGGSADLTIGGATTTIPVAAVGIATGLVTQDATVSLHVAGVTHTMGLGPDYGNVTSLNVGTGTTG